MFYYIEKVRELIREMTCEEFQQMINAEWFKNKSKQTGDVRINIIKNAYAIYNNETGLFRLKTPNYEFQYYWNSRGSDYPEFLKKLTKDYYCYSKLCAQDKKVLNVRKSIVAVKKELKKHLFETYIHLDIIESNIVKNYYKELTELKECNNLNTDELFNKLNECLSDIEYTTYSAKYNEKDIYKTMYNFVCDYETESCFVYEPSSKHKECIKYFEMLKSKLSCN